ncbi:aminotransferase class V-fold PLP-dependent enzyme [Humibacillus xanthopallidus]|uniref:Isopenicillin-N epimerase n=1 Tax=Humibacillus xanthopallidus TaxID=412689 RepID=A0A543HWC8_9MICO|nr:aminotransferase class V-fold PLP-dependent enzyme [Humibacillus xanthopallidus]TQM62615.1 isopenicillin-N epimerase [Humibacillus xanthopallidus]
MRRDIADLFELDPRLTHLNHGAFGAVPRAVREAQDRARSAVERAPMRAFRDELPAALEAARAAAAAFVGVPADTAALVRNVSEGVAVVLSSLEVGPGDEVVVSSHGYPTAAYAVQSRGATATTATFGLGDDPHDVVDAVARAVTDRTRLVIIDHITSPTALVLPVAEVAAAVTPVPVLVDAAHVPGALPGLVVEALGVDFWVGNLHKWSYTPRSAAVLWVAPHHRDRVRPLVTSWSHGLPFPASFDLQGTVDHSAWLAVPDGLAAWHALGGWQQVERNAELLRRGAEHVRTALGTPSPRAGIPTAPCLEVVALPPGVAETPEGAASLWQRLYAAGFVVPPVSFAGRGLLRLAAAPYNDEDDYERLADGLPALLGAGSSAP